MGHDVVVLCDVSGGFRDHVPDGSVFVQGSILDESLLERLSAEHRFDFGAVDVRSHLRAGWEPLPG